MSSSRPNLSCGAIVVLGCAVHDEGPSPALSRRITLAAQAHRVGVAEVVLASGGRTWNGRTEASVIRERLSELAPTARIRAEERSHSTAENAVYSAEILLAHGIERVMIATCRWHLPRAAANFRRCGLDVLLPDPTWGVGPRASLWTAIREQLACLRDAGLLATRGRLG